MSTKRIALLIGLTFAAAVLIGLCCIATSFIGTAGLLTLDSNAQSPCLNPTPGGTITLQPSTYTVTIPASATDLGNHCESWLDLAVYLWFDIDPADTDTFLAQFLELDFTYPPSFPTFAPAPRGGDSATFRTASVFPACDAPCSLNIWVETTDPTIHRVYIFFLYGS